MLICLIQRNQGHRDSMMHEFSSSVNKVNKAVAKVRTIGDRLPLIDILERMTDFKCSMPQKSTSVLL